MSHSGCWVIENYQYRPCADPRREFRSLVSLHNHSNHSVENLAALNGVVKLWFMRPFRRVLQKAFGLDGVRDLNYAEVLYSPPYAPEEVLRMEEEAVSGLGFDGVQLAITDHDEVAGSVELRERRPDQAHRIALAEELSVRFQRHLFHLGISGLPEDSIAATHAQLQAAARGGRLDELFESLHATGCLVVLNHPLVPWGRNGAGAIPVQELLQRYGWAIHALEFSGMRRPQENERVLELARHAGKPVVGGGDSHFLAPSAVICGSPDAEKFADFIQEVKSGRATPLIKSAYFAPLRWKLFLRVLSFIAHYRQIASYRGQSAQQMLGNRTVLLDPVGQAARVFLRLAAALQLVR